MEKVTQRLKPLKSKTGRTGSSVYGSTRGLGKGESEKQTSQRGQGEQGTSWKGYHVLAPSLAPGHWGKIQFLLERSVWEPVSSENHRT